MTFDQLEYFIAAAQQNTFFDAAEELHITQSALSKQIIRLEKELGVILFDRSHRKATLTKAGKRFYQEAEVLIRQYQAMRSAMEPYRQNAGSSISIGTLPILTQYHLTERLHTFALQNPSLHVSIEELEEPALRKALAQGLYDLVFARETLFAPEDDYLLHPIAEDELVALLPADHRLAVQAACKAESDESASVTLADLAKEPFLLMNPYTSVYALCMDILQSAGLKPHVLRTARVESLISAVSIGEGVSLIPRSNFSVFRQQNVAALSLSPPVSVPIVLAVKKEKAQQNGLQGLLKLFIQ